MELETGKRPSRTGFDLERRTFQCRCEEGIIEWSGGEERKGEIKNVLSGYKIPEAGSSKSGTFGNCRKIDDFDLHTQQCKFDSTGIRSNQ